MLILMISPTSFGRFNMHSLKQQTGDFLIEAMIGTPDHRFSKPGHTGNHLSGTAHPGGDVTPGSGGNDSARATLQSGSVRSRNPALSDWK